MDTHAYFHLVGGCLVRRQLQEGGRFLVTLAYLGSEGSARDQGGLKTTKINNEPRTFGTLERWQLSCMSPRACQAVKPKSTAAFAVFLLVPNEDCQHCASAFILPGVVLLSRLFMAFVSMSRVA